MLPDGKSGGPEKMKQQKLFLVGGLFLAVVVLGGCGTQQAIPGTNAPAISSTPQKSTTTPPASVTDSNLPSKEIALPATVSTQPGATVDAEVKNIDNDLKAMDDSSLTQGLSDKDLGVQ